MAISNAWPIPAGRLLINGQWVEPEGGQTLPVFDPATGENFTTIARGTAADVDLAVSAARACFESRAWTRMRPMERGRILERVALLIEKHAEELAWLESLDNGKPMAMAKMVDVAVAMDMFRYFAGWATKITGETFALNPLFDDGSDYHAYSLRQPVGVVGAITPWNFPVGQAAQKIAPALATGCTVVLKPSEETSLSTLRLGEILLEAGVPEGAVNIVTGLGAEAGAALVGHPDVRKISFTGSTQTGKAIAAACLHDLKRVTLELGGKSPAIVLADADLNEAIPGVANAIFFNSGQICTAGSRLLIERPVFDAVVEGVAAIADQLKIGPGHDSTTQIGPLVSAKQLEKVSGMVAEGIATGATAMAGGSAVDGAGFFYRPTILTNVRRDQSVVQEEIFGPVVVAMPLDEPDQIKAVANDTHYGLGASLWTNDLRRTHLIAKQIDAGSVWVNCHNVLDAAMPFGGFKQSGWGREFSNEAVRTYTELKSVCVRLPNA